MTRFLSSETAKKLSIFSRVDRDLCIAAPCISLTLYSAAPLAELSLPLAEMIQRYLSYVPIGSIKTIYIPGGDDDDDDYQEGYFQTFDEETRDDLIHDIYSDTFRLAEFYGLMLSGGENGEGASYGIRFQGSQLHQSDFTEKTNLLRLDIPVFRTENELERWGTFVAGAFEIYPSVTGVCGLSFGYTYSFEPEVRTSINSLVMRYLGSDISYDWLSREMRGKVAPINWLTFVDFGLMNGIGGLEAVERALSAAKCKRLRTGLLIRSAAWPSIGDINRLAPDIGVMPTVCKVLKSICFNRVNDVGMTDADNARRWLDRFDELNDRPWINR